MAGRVTGEKMVWAKWRKMGLRRRAALACHGMGGDRMDRDGKYEGCAWVTVCHPHLHRGEARLHVYHIAALSMRYSRE